MKRFHVHLAVRDLAESIRFYSMVFGVEPAVRKPDYAKWMIDDPRVNFAISQRGGVPGVNHLGLQVDTDDELQAMQQRLHNADQAMVTERDAQCCYANADKYWITDPQGIAWETFHTLGTIPMFGASANAASATSGIATSRPCCAPGAPNV
jgi:catechol 2,3-dioxygenase-like lactoylglutathione lyase family enzyme